MRTHPVPSSAPLHRILGILGLLLMLGSGCFYLEPVLPLTPGDADSGDGTPLPDGEQDGGEQPPPVGCADAVSPEVLAGIHLEAPEDVWMYLAPGNVVLPSDVELADGGKGLRIQLDAPATQRFSVLVLSLDPGTVEPSLDVHCVEVGDEGVDFGLHALQTGVTQVLALVDNRVIGQVNVHVVSDPPAIEAVTPRRGFYNGGDLIPFEVTLSHPFAEQVTARLHVSGGAEPQELEVAPGARAFRVEHVVPSEAPEVLEAHFQIGALESATLWLERAPQRLLISEFLLQKDHGFVEIHNPTAVPQPLDRRVPVVRQNGAIRWKVAPLDMVAGKVIAPRSFFLFGWGRFAADADVPLSALTRDPEDSDRLYLMTTNAAGDDVVETIDAVRYSRYWPYGDQSHERRGWAGASASEMGPGGALETSGNALDTRNDEDARTLDDFVLRAMPQPQNSLGAAESFFTPAP